jgi:Uncharacterized protein SCO1/SenC/PrrC, involved in biogenesis of respiratory and photosynthetic systems
LEAKRVQKRSNGPRRILLLLSIIVIVSGALAAYGFFMVNRLQQQQRQAPVVAATSFHGWLLDPPAEAPNIELVDQYGNPFRLSEHRGNVVVLFFGYTNCPDVCPATLAYYTQVKRELGELADRVRFVFVTVDPEYDTPERLERYISRFDPSFYGLWGTPEQIREIAAEYGVYVEKVEAEESPVGYWVNHTSFSFVIDPDGNWRLAHPFGTHPQDIAADLRRLL